MTLSGSELLAITIKVKKTKGTTALIDSSLPLDEGKIYSLNEDRIAEDPSFINTASSKKHSLTLSGQFSFLKGANTQENRIQLETRYGWSGLYLDYGPILYFDMTDLGAGYNTEFYVGGFFDYNLSPNRIQDIYFYGLTTQLSAGNLNYSSGASSQIYKFDAGGFINWFIFKNAAAVRFEGLYELKRVNSSVASTDISGLKGKLLIVLYY